MHRVRIIPPLHCHGRASFDPPQAWALEGSTHASKVSPQPPDEQCKECGGSLMASIICNHNYQKDMCKDHSGASMCEHNQMRIWCITPDMRYNKCGGKGFFHHKREKSMCKDCGRSQICEHNRMRIEFSHFHPGQSVPVSIQCREPVQGVQGGRHLPP